MRKAILPLNRSYWTDEFKIHSYPRREDFTILRRRGGKRKVYFDSTHHRPTGYEDFKLLVVNNAKTKRRARQMVGGRR